MSTIAQSEQEDSVGKGSDGKGADPNQTDMTSALVQVIQSVQDAQKKQQEQFQEILSEFRTEQTRSLASAAESAVQKALAKPPSHKLVSQLSGLSHNSHPSHREAKHKTDFDVVPPEIERTAHVSFASDDSQGDSEGEPKLTQGRSEHAELALDEIDIELRQLSKPSMHMHRSSTFESERGGRKETLHKNYAVHEKKALSSQVAQAALAEENEEEEKEYTEKTGWRRNIKTVMAHPWFDYFVATINISNAVTIAVQTNSQARDVTAKSSDFFHSVDIFFTIFFATELLLRMFVERHRFVTGHNKGWNAFDSFVVASAIFEHVLESSTNATAIRVLRIMRLVRIIRVIRTLRVFNDLRAMVTGIMHSFLSLLWAIVLLFMILFVISIFITQMVSSYRADEIENLRNNQDFDDALSHNFGSLMLTMYALYKAITGGDDWSKFSDPLFEVSTFLGWFFCFYIAFATFAVLNVITGVFVDNAIRGNQNDADTIILEQNEARKKHAEQVRKIFKKADVNHDDRLDCNEFQTHLSNPLVQAYFRQIGLEVEDDGGSSLFGMLDFDDSGSIDVSEFIFGCGHLKGYARSFDMAKMFYMNKLSQKKMSAKLASISEEQTYGFETLLQSFGTIYAQFQELQQMHLNLDTKVDAKLDQQRTILPMHHDPPLMNVCKEDTKKHMQCVEALDLSVVKRTNESQSEASITTDVPEEVVKPYSPRHSEVVYQGLRLDAYVQETANSSSELSGNKVSSLVEEPPQPSEVPGHKASALVEEPPQPSEMPAHKVSTLVEEAPHPLEMTPELVRATHHTSPVQRSPEKSSDVWGIPNQGSNSKSPKPRIDSESGPSSSGLEYRSATSKHPASDQAPLDLWQDMVQVLWRWKPESDKVPFLT